ncbi:MAG TPA: ATP-binding protein [Pseudonocardiaceae bacterium]|nr:ATP-binding protein [Pseudonocardiaceae bacterium]
MPAVAMAVLGAAAAFVLAVDQSPAVVITVSVVGVVACVAILLFAVRQARSAARALARQANEPQRAFDAAMAGLTEFHGRITDFVAALQRGQRPTVYEPPAEPTADRDRFAALARRLQQTENAVEVAFLRAAENLPHGDPLQQLTVFGNLGRRQQSLVHRAIRMLDELENQVEDPDLLKGLFALDHLVTRIRRQTENLVVLGGAPAQRQWSTPLTMVAVLRSSIAEVEQYNRVKLVLPIKGTLRGHAVAEIVHLLAELIENATVFSNPDTTVMLRAQHVTAGLAIEVEDRGLGMHMPDLDRINELFASPDSADIGELLANGLIGLWVVAQLGRRNGVKVRLQTNIFGGISADVVIPRGLLGEEPEHEPSRPQRHELLPAGAPAATEQSNGHASGDPQAAITGRVAVVARQEDARRQPPAQPAQPSQPNWSPPPNGDPLPQRQPQHQWPPNPDPAAPATATTQQSYGSAGQAPPTYQPQRPPLPKRPPGMTHLAPQLLNQPEVSKDVTGHTPNLMASFLEGIRTGTDEEPADPGHSSPDE